MAMHHRLLFSFLVLPMLVPWAPALPQTTKTAQQEVLNGNSPKRYVPDEKLLLAKARQGDTSAQWWLGTGYEQGWFGTPDFPQALKWLRKSAEKDNPDAQNALGQMYENGEGVSQNYTIAAKWYKKAAEHVPDLGGAGQGRNNLGLLYLDGRGVPKDYVQAYMWFSLSSDCNYSLPSAKDHMTPAQIVEAERLVAEWKSKHKTTPKPLCSFLVTEVMSSPQKDKPYPITWTSARAVREDGSWVRILIRSSPFQNERDIYDFKSGVYTIVDDATKSVVRQKISPEEYTHRLAAAASCQGTPAGRILDIDVNYAEQTGSLETEHGEAATLIKSWVAPDLGCFVLQKETIWTRNTDGALLVDTKITPISISFQPIEEFFSIPTSYNERTKEEVLNQLNQRNLIKQKTLDKLVSLP